MIVDRPLPHSPENERAFLGSFILGAPSDELDRIDELELFLPAYRVIFHHLKKLRDSGKPTNDSVLLYDSLAGAQEIEAAGGIAFISQLADGIPRLSNLAEYASIIKTKAMVRRQLALVESIREKLAGANGNATEVLREVSVLSVPLREDVAQKRILNFETGADIAAVPDQKVAWICRGLVAKGAVTELNAKVKSGKTTLVLEMVRAVIDGRMFLGNPTLKTPVLYLTEQPLVSFREALSRAKLLGRAEVLVLPFTATHGLSWPEVASAAVAECKRVGSSLLIVDTLPQFAGLAGDKENNSGDALEAMRPIQHAASENIGVLLVRHERKAGGDVGDSGRGSSAFAGVVDIVFSLRKSEGNAPKSRRVLQSLSRFSETPSDLLIELTEDGYNALGDRNEVAVLDARDSILAVLPATEAEAQDLGEIAKSADVTRRTAQRAMEELMTEKVVSRIGKGKKGDAFRYFRAEMPFCATSNVVEQKSRNEIDELWDSLEANDE